MSDLLDALMEQFPMPSPALFAANDVDKCVSEHPEHWFIKLGKLHSMEQQARCIGSSASLLTVSQDPDRIKGGRHPAVPSVMSCSVYTVPSYVVQGSNKRGPCCGRLLDDDSISNERLIAGERPPLLATFERRAAEDETPYRAIMDSLYFFQASMPFGCYDMRCLWTSQAFNLRHSRAPHITRQLCSLQAIPR